MAFGIFQGDFFPVSTDEILVGSFGGKGTGREILLPEEVLLQLSCMVREKKIMEPAAVILSRFFCILCAYYEYGRLFFLLFSFCLIRTEAAF